MATGGAPYQFNVSEKAQNDAAALWLDADSAGREAITQALRLVERVLRYDPDQKGMLLVASHRVFWVHAAPLLVTYRVNDDDMRVEVISIRGANPGLN